MKKIAELFLITLMGAFSFTISSTVSAHPSVVNCATHSLQAAINRAKPGYIIVVKGICEEEITIKTNDLTIVGNRSENNAVISTTSALPATLLTILSAVRVTIEGIDIKNSSAENTGSVGLLADAGASFTFKNSNINGLNVGMHLKNNSNVKLDKVKIDASGAVGLDVTSGSAAEVVSELTIINNNAFGLEVIDGGEMRLNANTILTLTGNLLGAQISGGATVFVDTGAKIIADNNILIGFSVNTGASMVMFNADISVSGNGLDGLDVVSSASLDIDGNSTLTANDNRREGISLDNGSLNIFGFFSTQPGLPKIIANNNTNNGIQVEFGGKLDIGRNSSIEAKDNGMAGISLDDGSIANIHDSIITGNNGLLSLEVNNDDSNENTDNSAIEPGDVVLTFGSRISFQGKDDVGRVLCDMSSMARGEIQCTH